MEPHFKLLLGVLALCIITVVSANGKAVAEILPEDSENRIFEVSNKENASKVKLEDNPSTTQQPSLSDAKAEKKSFVKGAAKIVAFVIGAAVFVIIVCVVCCCCCPFCLLAKRKERGRVIRQNVYNQPAQNAGAPSQQRYAAPPEQHQQIPSQQAYPPSGYNQPISTTPFAYPNQAGPMPASQGYAMDQPPPYPGPPIQQYQPHQAGGQYGEDARTQKMEYQTQPACNPNAPS